MPEELFDKYEIDGIIHTATFYGRNNESNGQSMDFLSFNITHILTDNGLEFIDRLLKSKKGEPCKKLSLLDEVCIEKNIEHRLTEPLTPKTNGMVERVNRTIKDNTIKINTYEDIE